MNREKKRERDLRYYASEKGRANRQRKLARARERWLSDPQWRFRRKLFSMRSRARRVLAQPSPARSRGPQWDACGCRYGAG